MIPAWVVKIIVVPLVIASGFIFYRKFPNIKQDNTVEELFEDFVEEQFGYCIDMSPETPEGNNGNK